MKKAGKVLAIALVLMMVLALSVSAASFQNTATLTKTMYYASGINSSIPPGNETYYSGNTYSDSSATCTIALYCKLTNGTTTVVNSRIAAPGTTLSRSGPFDGSNKNAFYMYLQPWNTTTGLGGHAWGQCSNTYP